MVSFIKGISRFLAAFVAVPVSMLAAPFTIGYAVTTYLSFRLWDWAFFGEWESEGFNGKD